MSSESAKLAMLEAWMRDKEGEDLEFKQAERNFHFDSLGRSYAALADSSRTQTKGWLTNKPLLNLGLEMNHELSGYP